MARYNLIISDNTFHRMLDYGAKHEKTVGRLINDILNAYDWEDKGTSITAVEKPKLVNPCGICHNKEGSVTLEHIGTGKQKVFCVVCSQNALEGHKWKVL